MVSRARQEVRSAAFGQLHVFRVAHQLSCVRFVRTATIAPGKLAEAIGLAHQIAKLVDKIAGLKVGVSMPVAGNPFRIAWVAAEPDLASVGM